MRSPWCGVNGKVFTDKGAQLHAQAVAVQNGAVLAVGTDEKIRSPGTSATRIIDVSRRLVTPGSVEAHLHIGQGLPSQLLALPNMPFPDPAADQVLAAVLQAAKEH